MTMFHPRLIRLKTLILSICFIVCKMLTSLFHLLSLDLLSSVDILRVKSTSLETGVFQIWK